MTRLTVLMMLCLLALLTLTACALPKDGNGQVDREAVVVELELAADDLGDLALIFEAGSDGRTVLNATAKAFDQAAERVRSGDPVNLLTAIAIAQDFTDTISDERTRQRVQAGLTAAKIIARRVDQRLQRQSDPPVGIDDPNPQAIRQTPDAVLLIARLRRDARHPLLC